MNQTLVILAAVASVPLLLLGLHAAFAWRYRRLVRSSMRGADPTTPAAAELAVSSGLAGRSSLVLTYVRPVDVQRCGCAERLAADADAITRLVERAVIASAVVYLLIVWIGVGTAFAAAIPLDARLVANYLLVTPFLFIICSVLSFTRRRIVVLATTYASIGIVGLVAFTGTNRFVMLVSALGELFAIVPLAGLVLLVSRRLRPLLVALAGVAIYLVTTFTVAGVMLQLGVVHGMGEVRWWVWLVSALNMLFAFVVFAWLLRLPSARVAVAGLAAAGATGALIEWRWNPRFPFGAIPLGLALSVFQVYVPWWIFRVFLWCQDRHLLPAQLLHVHLLFGFVTCYLVLLVHGAGGGMLFGEQRSPLVIIVAAFVCQATTLHVRVHRIWQRRRRRHGKRLLLLRVFGATTGRERLLDRLENTWRRVGRIDLIGATDYAMHTLSSRMLEAFFLQKTANQFVKSERDWLLRQGQLHSSLQGDVRYPINEIYCQGAVWQRVVRDVATGADAVLMDLRGFTMANRGCAFEVREIVQHVSLRRIVLLTDETTDLQALEQVARTGWLDAPATSPSAGDPSPELKVLHAVGSRASEPRVLDKLLFDAAVEPGRAMGS